MKDIMYRFNIVQDEDGAWRFELNGINLLLDGFTLRDEKHWINNPAKAIAFFKVNGHLYGVSNDMKSYPTVEDFYDSMKQQYSIFKRKKLSGDLS